MQYDNVIYACHLCMLVRSLDNLWRYPLRHDDALQN